MNNKKLLKMELRLQQAILRCKESYPDISSLSNLVELLQEYNVIINRLSNFAFGNALLGGSMLGMYLNNGLLSNEELIQLLSGVISNPSTISNFDNMPLYLLVTSSICFANAWAELDYKTFLKRVLEKNDIRKTKE